MAVHRVDHPLVRHKLGIMRGAGISTYEFRALTLELTRFLLYEATKDLEMESRTIQGWAGPVKVESVRGKKITLVPILRAGIGMLDGALDLIPGAKVSVVGLYRNEQTLEPVSYYVKLASDMPGRMAIILDPMLATGGTLMTTIELLKKAGCRKIKGVFLVAAPEGLNRIAKAHPDIDIYLASIDERLNDKGYIIPGLGDAGDKIFGTR